MRSLSYISGLGLGLVLSMGLSGCSSSSSSSGGGTPAVNSAPSINTTFSDVSVNENSGLTNYITNYEINVSDADGDDLTLSVESNDTSIITVTPNWSGAINEATYLSQLDFNLTTKTNVAGNVKISLTLSDGESNTTASFDVNVRHIFKNGESWKGLVYGTVTSKLTGKVWLDRNLGASQVCTAFNDTKCYGDYYQWGRNADGHQEANSTTTATLATDINATNVNGSFIILSSPSDPDWTSADLYGSLRSANWSKTDGSSVCPIGYRVPTITELTAETTAVANNVDAFNNFLKLPSAGFRNVYGTLSNQGSSGYVWSSSASDSYSKAINYYSSPSTFRIMGFSVRCLRD